MIIQHPQTRAFASGAWLLTCAALAASCSSSGDPDGTDTSATGGSSRGGAGAQSTGAQSRGGDLSLGAGPTVNDGGATEGGATNDVVSPEAACAKSSETTEALPAVLELVIDTSGSMDWPPGWAPQSPDDSKPPGATKWEITRDALAEAVDALGADIALGASFYPNVEQEDDVCLRTEVALPIAALGAADSAPREHWAEALADVVPVGATPTHGAYRFGLSSLAGSTLPGDKFLLLITDGTPTCDLECSCTEDNLPVDSLPLVREAAAARDQGIRTFVIGSPGSEQTRDVLSRLASEGGTAPAGCTDSGPRYCHFDMTTEPDLASGLAQALSEISSRVRSCVYPIPAAPDGEKLDPDLVNVLYTPGGDSDRQTIARAGAGDDCSEGWQYTSDGASVELCAETCARAQADTQSQVEILFGCQTVVQKPR